jgi:hypothetical protein
LRVRQIEAQARLLDQGLSLPEPARKPAYEPRPRSLLYCAASALPWHTSGYTTRTQALLQAPRMAAQGGTLTALTRAGYPWDRSDSTAPEDMASITTGSTGTMCAIPRSPCRSISMSRGRPSASRAWPQRAKWR